MKKVDNDFVSMDWDVEGFIEYKSTGFDSAVHVYDGVAVVFHEGRAYLWYDDEEGQVADFATVVAEIKKAHKEKDSDFPDYYEDNYIELYDGSIWNEDALELNGLVAFKEDMKKRCEDLSCYNIEE